MPQQKKTGKPTYRPKKPLRKGDPEQGLLLLLLDMFSVMDDVFTEPDAFKRCNVSLGALYSAWKRARMTMDPNFEQYRHRYKRDLYER